MKRNKEFGLFAKPSIKEEKMCLAVPSEVVSISENMGIVDVDGVRREVSLLLLDDIKIGDYVIVHAGFAINKIDESEARETLKIIRNAFSSGDGP